MADSSLIFTYFQDQGAQLEVDGDYEEFDVSKLPKPASDSEDGNGSDGETSEGDGEDEEGSSRDGESEEDSSDEKETGEEISDEEKEERARWDWSA